MEILKAWISVDGVAVDDEAIPSTVFLDLENGRVRLGFPTRATEIDAIARGKRFRVDRDFEMTRTLVCTPSGTSSCFTDESGVTGYEILEQKAISTQALVWIESGTPPYVNAAPVEVVDKITSDSQIVIKAGGLIEVSRNLIGQRLRSRIPVFVDKRVTVLLEPLEKFCLHIITKKPPLEYLEAIVTITTKPPQQNGARFLEGNFDPTELKKTEIAKGKIT